MSNYPSKFKTANQFGDAPGALIMDSFSLIRKNLRESLDGTEARRLQEFYNSGLTEEQIAKRTEYYKRQELARRAEIDRMIDVFSKALLRRIEEGR